MKKCRDLQGYSLDQMDEAQKAEIKAHLADCPSCQKNNAFWDRFQGDFGDWTQSKIQPNPTDENSRQFMERVAGQDAPSLGFKRVFVWGSAVAATAAVIIIALNITSTTPVLKEQPVASVAQGPLVAPITAVPKIFESTPLETKVKRLFDDTVGLDVNSRLAVLETGPDKTRVRLERGYAAFDVEPKQEGATFEVQVAASLIRVVGTRFSVEYVDTGQFEIAVIEGEVEVTDKHFPALRVESGSRLLQKTDGNFEMHQLEAADSRQIDRVLGRDDVDDGGQPNELERPKALKLKKSAPVLETLATYREMVLSGRLEEAQSGLKRYVTAHPGDDDGWMLLADCERKLENWPGSVRAYKAAMKSSNSRVSAKATYMAAEVLGRRLKNHQEASRLYEKYLGSSAVSPGLKDAAKVSYSRSLIAVGHKNKARQVLNEVVAASENSLASQNAKHLLESLGTKE